MTLKAPTLKMLAKSALLAASYALTIGGAVQAEGGNDPISGIDIIIKKDPGSKPIKPFSFDEREIKQINTLRGDDRPIYTLKIIAQEIGAGEAFVAAGAKAFENIWCGPCKMLDEASVRFETGNGEAYALTVRFKTPGVYVEEIVKFPPIKKP